MIVRDIGGLRKLLTVAQKSHLGSENWQCRSLKSKTKQNTRMHSSRMRTTRLLPVISRHALLGGGGSAWSQGGVAGPGGCTWSGGGVPGLGGVYLVQGGVPGPGAYLVWGVYLV